ncbi:Anthranilate phosphoribosyltransferase [hydrothermal vent metagenome]|uniref:anthranilate phosphoribosyltransferase n=1 Tax=hydrothermal vent metagenome TaxID=652676 RepID=A0A3B1E940_9ZZZZ
MFDEIKLIFDKIFDNTLSDSKIKDYLIKLYEEGETPEQIAAAVLSMREHLISLDITQDLQNMIIDNCGTGGDKSNSFNISTTVSLLLSACGCKVAKHGNRSVTSKSGSADMLEALGINLDISLEKQTRMLNTTGFTFMFAQKHHPCMKHIMPIRKSISHRTIFNILGPLTNPAGATKQLIGVFSKKYVNSIAIALTLLGNKKAIVVSSADGMDEISISDITYATLVENNRTKDFIIDPREYGFKLYDKKDIIGGDAIKNATITKAILDGSTNGAKRDIVLLNTAVALMIDNKVDCIEDGIKIAQNAINNKDAINKLNDIIKFSNNLI